MRRFRCKHRWTETNRTFNPPTNRDVEVRWIDGWLLERILHGVTVVELRCEECGYKTFTEALGRVGFDRIQAAS